MSNLTGRICVFTGSRHGVRSEYAEAAKRLGRDLAARNYGLVYGGGNVGLMTVIADTVLELDGQVTGVIPDSLVSKEVAHTGLTDPRAAGLKPEQFIDGRFFAELDKEGFIQKLWN
jgi:uncharacterized protein (TIGR00730 family)